MDCTDTALITLPATGVAATAPLGSTQAATPSPAPLFGASFGVASSLAASAAASTGLGFGSLAAAPSSIFGASSSAATPVIPPVASPAPDWGAMPSSPAAPGTGVAASQGVFHTRNGLVLFGVC